MNKARWPFAHFAIPRASLW